MDAGSLGFPSGSLDAVLCGFMGWGDCFDFVRNEFTQPDTKASEIRRVLREGGRFVCCSWERQEDLRWMEEEMLRHFPALLEDRNYLDRRPIGMSYETAEGYGIILRSVGFREMEVSREIMTFVSSDEEEWWQQMQAVGWASLIDKIEKARPDELRDVKEAIFQDLQAYMHSDGLHFEKTVFFVRAIR